MGARARCMFKLPKNSISHISQKVLNSGTCRRVFEKCSPYAKLFNPCGQNHKSQITTTTGLHVETKIIPPAPIICHHINSR
jgi:hypothetical protein